MLIEFSVIEYILTILPVVCNMAEIFYVDHKEIVLFPAAKSMLAFRLKKLFVHSRRKLHVEINAIFSHSFCNLQYVALILKCYFLHRAHRTKETLHKADTVWYLFVS